MKNLLPRLMVVVGMMLGNMGIMLADEPPAINPFNTPHPRLCKIG